MTMTLAELSPGLQGRILRLPDGLVRAQAIRFGLAEGADVLCCERIPRGPIVIRRGLQQIALGRALAATITVDVPEAK